MVVDVGTRTLMYGPLFSAFCLILSSVLLGIISARSVGERSKKYLSGLSAPTLVCQNHPDLLMHLLYQSVHRCLGTAAPNAKWNWMV